MVMGSTAWLWLYGPRDPVPGTGKHVCIKTTAMPKEGMLHHEWAADYARLSLTYIACYMTPLGLSRAIWLHVGKPCTCAQAMACMSCQACSEQHLNLAALEMH